MLTSALLPQSLYARAVIESKFQGRKLRTFRIIALDVPENSIWLLELTNKRPESLIPERHLLSVVQGALGITTRCVEDKIRLHRMDARGVNFTADERKVRIQRLRVLGPLRWESSMLALCKKDERKKLIAERAKKIGVAPARIHKLLLLYRWFGMDWNALLPLHALKGAADKARLGGPIKKGRPNSHQVIGTEGAYKGVNVRKRDLANFEKAIFEHYIKQDVSLADTYDRMSSTMYVREHLGKDGEKYSIALRPELIPSLGQFYYHAEQIIKKNKWAPEKHGGLEYRQHHDSYLGNTADICLGPCDIFDTDCTSFKVNCQLYTGLGHQVIKQKTICFVVDRYSYAVAGFFAFSGAESWDIYRQALFVAFSDKSGLCSSADIDPALWQIHHLPNKLFVDRGPARSFDAHESIVNGLKIARAVAPPREAQLKAVVENVQGILQKRLASLPGGTRRTVRIRDKDKSKKSLDGPLPTSQELNNCIVAAIVEHNQSMDASHLRTADMLRDGVSPNPAAIFEWGLANCVGTYGRVVPRQDVYVVLLRNIDVSVQASGIELHKAWFHCGALKSYRQANFKGGKSPRISVSHDPIRRLLYWMSPTGALIAIPMKKQSEAKYEAMDWEDIDEFIPHEKVSLKEQEHARRNKNLLGKRRTQTIESAAKRLDDTSPQVRSAGKRDINENKNRQRAQEEKELRAEKDEVMETVDAFTIPLALVRPTRIDNSVQPLQKEVQSEKNTFQAMFRARLQLKQKGG